MKISTTTLIIAALLLVTVASCGKKGGGVTPDPVIPDTTKPAITITKPTAGQAFTAGSAIVFEASFSDNISLKSYEIEVSKVVATGFVLKNVPLNVPFSWVKSSTGFTAGVKQQTITINDINIPANSTTQVVTTGNYNFKVTCLDGTDNTVSTIVMININ